MKRLDHVPSAVAGGGGQRRESREGGGGQRRCQRSTVGVLRKSVVLCNEGAVRSLGRVDDDCE